MRWARKRGMDPESLEARFRALARLIERRGFRARGLVTIEADGDFIVRGMRQIADGEPVGMSNETISKGEVLMEIDSLSA